MSITTILHRLHLVELKANPPKPEERLPYVVLDAATGEDIPGFASHNAEHRALAQRSGIAPKEYGFDVAELFAERPHLAYTDDELLAQFRAIDENSIPKEHDAAPLVQDGKRLYRTWFRSDQMIVENAAARGGPLPDRETIWQWIEAFNPFPQ